jgi:putative endonuclease
MVAFVEVRTRWSTDFGTPAESVGWRKQRELGRSARAWIASNRRSGDSYRFDVVGVILGDAEVRIQYVPNAFWLR